jgi:hypothetical protein
MKYNCMLEIAIRTHLKYVRKEFYWQNFPPMKRQSVVGVDEVSGLLGYQSTRRHVPEDLQLHHVLCFLRKYPEQGGCMVNELSQCCDPSWLAINATYAYTPQSASACCPYQLTHHPAWLKAAAPRFGEDSKMLPRWWVSEVRRSVVFIVQWRLCQWLGTAERNSECS